MSVFTTGAVLSDAEGYFGSETMACLHHEAKDQAPVNPPVRIIAQLLR